MTLPRLVDLVEPGARAQFVRYQSGELWYRVKGFEFPISIADTGDGAFLPEDRALFFMRWIRRHLIMLENARREQEE